MLTPEEITAGTNRLDQATKKIKSDDVDKLVSTFRRVFAGLESIYQYKFQEKLEGVTDLGNEAKQAGQIVGCLIKMEELGFPVGELTGTKFGIKASAYEEFLGFVLFAFSKFYPIPVEFATYDIRWAILSGRGRRGGRGSSSSVRKNVIWE